MRIGNFIEFRYEIKANYGFTTSAVIQLDSKLLCASNESCARDGLRILYFISRSVRYLYILFLLKEVEIEINIELYFGLFKRDISVTGYFYFTHIHTFSIFFLFFKPEESVSSEWFSFAWPLCQVKQ